MKKFDNIILSDTAPSTCSIWLKDGKLYYFSNGAWVEIYTASVTQAPESNEPTKPNE